MNEAVLGAMLGESGPGPSWGYVGQCWGFVILVHLEAVLELPSWANFGAMSGVWLTALTSKLVWKHVHKSAPCMV